MPNRGKTVSKLGLAEQIKLGNELTAMSADLKAGKYSLATLANFLAQKLGFTITEANVKYVIHSMQLEFTSRGGGKPGAGTISIYGKMLARVEDLERRVTELENIKTAP